MRLTDGVAFDPLTGLANWPSFAERATAALKRAARVGWSTAVLVVDIDRFHAVNDRRGRRTGDLMLIEIGRRLDRAFRSYDAVVRPGGTVAHMGGDEFVVLCENVPNDRSLRLLGDRVLTALQPPVQADGEQIVVTAGVGIAVTQPGEMDVEQLLGCAEAALRQAKRQGAGVLTLFTPGLSDPPHQAHATERELEQALEAGQLRVHYQPKIALDRDRIVGVEALLRWEHPERGLVGPGEIIPVAETTGLIVPIGAFVLQEACREAAHWRNEFPDRLPLVVSVNVSARQFGPGLVEVVASALAEAGASPDLLCLEVTESLLMDGVAGSVTVLQELAQLGVALSIDDFGTGYSSLGYLRRFALDELKIDKSFVDGLGSDPDATAIAAAIIAMAHALGLRVVAEGVETEAQLERLRTLGCEEAQGFYFARPSTPAQIDKLLQNEASASWGRHVGPGQQPSERGSYRAERILVADDAADVRQLVRMSLAAVGFEVHEAFDGFSALAALRALTPDCVVLNLVMRDGSGLEICRQVRAGSATRNCAILIVTGNDDAADKVAAFSAGADDYIVKPFSPRDLASRVQAAMRRRYEPSRSPAPTYDAGCSA